MTKSFDFSSKYYLYSNSYVRVQTPISKLLQQNFEISLLFFYWFITICPSITQINNFRHLYNTNQTARVTIENVPEGVTTTKMPLMHFLKNARIKSIYLKNLPYIEVNVENI